MSIQGSKFTISPHVADLPEWQLILRVDWLMQLGDFNCNYKTKALQFKWQGQDITLTPSTQLLLEGSCAQISEVIPHWQMQIAENYVNDPEIQELIVAATVDQSGPHEYYMRQGLLMYRGKWVVGNSGNLRKQVFEELHCQNIEGHSGQRATVKRILEYFYWPSIRQNIGTWIRECWTCQQNKGENIKSTGLLLPLNIPQES